MCFVRGFGNVFVVVLVLVVAVLPMSKSPDSSVLVDRTTAGDRHVDRVGLGTIADQSARVQL
jgi:hypothetical protein